MNYFDNMLNVTMASNIVYNTNASTVVGSKLDLYRPTTYKVDGPTWTAGEQPPAPVAGYPLIVYAHGGGFVAGTKFDSQPLAIELASRGYAVAAIDYRKPPYQFPVNEIYSACDMRAAIRWAKANAGLYNLDATKIVAMGESAGGFAAVFSAIGDWEEPNSVDWPANSGADSRPHAVCALWAPITSKFDITQAPFITNIVAGNIDVFFGCQGKLDPYVPPAEMRALWTQIVSSRGSGKAFYTELNDALHTPFLRIPIGTQGAYRQGFIEDAMGGMFVHLIRRLGLE